MNTNTNTDFVDQTTASWRHTMVALRSTTILILASTGVVFALASVQKGDSNNGVDHPLFVVLDQLIIRESITEPNEGRDRRSTRLLLADDTLAVWHRTYGEGDPSIVPPTNDAVFITAMSNQGNAGGETSLRHQAALIADSPLDETDGVQVYPLHDGGYLLVLHHGPQEIMIDPLQGEALEDARTATLARQRPFLRPAEVFYLTANAPPQRVLTTTLDGGRGPVTYSENLTVMQNQFFQTILVRRTDRWLVQAAHPVGAVADAQGGVEISPLNMDAVPIARWDAVARRLVPLSVFRSIDLFPPEDRHLLDPGTKVTP